MPGLRGGGADMAGPHAVGGELECVCVWGGLVGGWE